MIKKIVEVATTVPEERRKRMMIRMIARIREEADWRWAAGRRERLRRHLCPGERDELLAVP